MHIYVYYKYKTDGILFSPYIHTYMYTYIHHENEYMWYIPTLCIFIFTFITFLTPLATN